MVFHLWVVLASEIFSKFQNVLLFSSLNISSKTKLQVRTLGNLKVDKDHVSLDSLLRQLEERNLCYQFRQGQQFVVLTFPLFESV